jgi:hypothetical protein
MQEALMQRGINNQFLITGFTITFAEISTISNYQ